MTSAGYDEQGRPVGPHGPFSPEQAHAIGRRSGSLLLSANAGAGKTSVMAERFARLVVEDDVAPGRILAITFTDKAAGELRARIRGRLMDLGGREAVRRLDRGWISTFHGLCARILRAHAVRAGLDPRFAVLEEADARALRGAAFDAALAALLDGDRPEVLEVAAAYGVDRLAEMTASAYDTLRSRGITEPRLVIGRAPAEPDPARLQHVLAAAAAELEMAGTGKKVGQARAAVARAISLTDSEAGGRRVSLRALAATRYSPGNTRALAGGQIEAARDALAAEIEAREAMLEHAALAVLDELLAHFHSTYAEAKTARTAVDFDDLELFTRDLLRGDRAIRDSYRERFESIMVDEFQDTNPVQLELLELLGEDRFAVGDVLQSIYGFRHADVEIFRRERARLAPSGGFATLAANYRTRPEILTLLDAAFGAGHGDDHVAFDPGRPPAGGGPLTELLLVDETACEDWPDDCLDGPPGASRWRRAEAALLADRIAAIVAGGGFGPGDIVVLLRSLKDVGLYEQALEHRGLTTLAAGGGGYWSRQPVLDLCAYLALLANRLDEEALFGVLGSPLVGLSSDALAIIAGAAGGGQRAAALRGLCCNGAEDRDEAASVLAEQLPERDRKLLDRFWPWLEDERRDAPRRPLADLLDRVVDRSDYDLHLLGLHGGQRRWANVQKLVRLAAGYESRNGRDLRGFIDLATAEADAGARESDEPVSAGDGTAVRLMTIHAAKGLEFPVVAVADHGRGRPATRADLLVEERRAGLRLRTADGHTAERPGWADLRDEAKAADEAELRRVLHVAMTRAQERLLLCGPVGANGSGRGDSPLRWMLPLLTPDLPSQIAAADSDGDIEFMSAPPGADAELAVTVRRTAVDPGTAVRAAAPPPAEPRPAPRPRGRAAVTGEGQLSFTLTEPGAAEPPSPEREPAAPLPDRPALRLPPPAAISYSALARFERCAYRYHLERGLGLPQDALDPLLRTVWGESTKRRSGTLDPMLRGSLVHSVLELVDLRRPRVPDHAEFQRLADLAAPGTELTAADDDDLGALVGAALGAELFTRLTAAETVHREHSFVLDLDGDDAPLLHGIVDVIAFERGGTALVVDWKTDALDDRTDLDGHVEERYGIQRMMYALAALDGGAARVDVAHLYLARPETPALASFTSGDRAELRSALLDRCTSLIAGDATPSPSPHAALCAGCPARRGLCTHPREVTERVESGR